LFVGSGSISFEGSSIKSRCLLKWRRPHILYTDPARSLKEQLRSGDATGRQRVTSLRGQICSETPPTVFTSHFIRRHLYTNESLLPVTPPFVRSRLRQKVVRKSDERELSPFGHGACSLARRGDEEDHSSAKRMRPGENRWKSRMTIPVTDTESALSARRDLTKVSRNVNGFRAPDRRLSSSIGL